MKVAVIFDPDPELGADRLDEYKRPRRLGEFLDDNDDVLLVWREWGDEFEDGYRTHVVGQGVYENVDVERIAAAFAYIEALGDDE